jgi:multidrug efflux pump subunit AcrA (membrane-fusion protein)
MPRHTSRKRQSIFYTAVLWGLLALGASSLSLLSGCAASSESAVMQAATPVDMLPVQQGVYEENTELMAQVNSKHATDIRPQVSGRILRVLVSDGQQVQQGQPLFQLDASQVRATVQSLSSVRQASMQEPELLTKNMEGLQADLAAARADLDYSRKQLGRYRELVDDQTVSQQETEQYQTDVVTRQQRINSIRANIASLAARRKEAVANIGRDTAALASASSNLSYFTVRAPFSGQVGTLIAKEGDVVDPGIALTTLTDNRNLEIEVAVSADDRPRIHMGMPLKLLNMRDEALGTLQTSYIAPKVDPLTQTFLLKARLDNDKNQLAMDQHLKVRLIWGERQALMIPVVAVMRMDGMPFVYRLETKPDKTYIAHLQAVHLGDIVDDNVVILSGLKSGDLIVKSGIQKLQDGAIVAQSTH